MTDAEKAREYADRIAEINSAVSSGKVNLEQARLNIETYKWLASKLDPDNYGANSKTKSETDLNQCKSSDDLGPLASKTKGDICSIASA